jgi:hypothetical protein
MHHDWKALNKSKEAFKYTLKEWKRLQEAVKVEVSTKTKRKVIETI